MAQEEIDRAIFQIWCRKWSFIYIALIEKRAAIWKLQQYEHLFPFSVFEILMATWLAYSGNTSDEMIDLALLGRWNLQPYWCFQRLTNRTFKYFKTFCIRLYKSLNCFWNMMRQVCTFYIIIYIISYCYNISKSVRSNVNKFHCTGLDFAIVIPQFSMSVMGFTVAGKECSEVKSIFVCEERVD